MTAKVGLAPVVAVLFVALAGESVISADAREDTNCLAAPGAQAPPGRHWFYRVDRPKQCKCGIFAPKRRWRQPQERR